MRMQVIGHRGCRDHFPENTLAAIRGAAPHVNMVEIDVRRCKTGEIVVFHDEYLDSLTDASGPVRDWSYGELSSLTVAGSEETIPTLEDALDAVPAGTGINVELKEEGMRDDVAPLLRDLDAALVVSSFEESTIAAFREEPIPTANLFADSFEKNVDIAAELGCEFVHPQYEITDSDSIKQAHERGLRVNAWTVPTEEEVRRLHNAGVDGVVVDSWEVIPE